MIIIFKHFEIEIKKKDQKRFLNELDMLCQKYAKPIKNEKYETFRYGFTWEDQD